jgi:hypothetical protein
MYSFRQIFGYVLIIMVVASMAMGTVPVQAKKKSGGSVKAMQKEWEPNAKNLATLLEKARSRKLFTPQDANTLNELMKAGAGIQGKYAASEEGAAILYDLGVLYMYRDKYFEAYDMFNTIKENHDGTTIGRKSVYQISRIKTQLGDDFAMLEGDAPPKAAATPSKKPPTKK